MYEVTLIKEIFAVVIHCDGGFVDPRESERRVFVCGSLMDPEFAAKIVSRKVAVCPAVAVGYARAWREVDGVNHHFLVEERGGILPGMAILGLDERDIEKLKAFENAPKLRREVTMRIKIGDNEMDAITYIGNE
ncbi:MAG TPA: gamma-glutamylcyclotransferase [bacterium]|nr:gamma-glutamylcyclotransferase [bacterium]